MYLIFNRFISEKSLGICFIYLFFFAVLRLRDFEQISRIFFLENPLKSTFLVSRIK